jgi:hypothetical protein
MSHCWIPAIAADSGAIRATVSKTYRLDQLASAYEVLAGGTHAGNFHRSLTTDQLVHPWSGAAPRR